MIADKLPPGSMRGRGPRGHRRSDGQIFEDICDRLTDAPEVDASDLEVTVEGGEVELRGTVLDRGMRGRAEEIADAVSGVRHVRNDIRVRPQGTAATSAGYGTPVVATFGLEAQGQAVPDRPAALDPNEERSRTVAALFDDAGDAERALVQLEATGYDRTSVQITPDSAASGDDAGVSESGLLSRLKSMFLPDSDREAYTEGIRRGGALVTAVVSESRADEVVALLQQAGAVDLDARRGEWRATGWREYEPLVEGSGP